MGSYGAGAFSGQADSALEVFFDEIEVEEVGGQLFIEYLCSCSLPVVRLKTDRHFGCVHCDSVCYNANCPRCIELYLTDNFEEEEGDEDANL